MATFALVPGAGGSGWYWHRVVPELVRRGHRAVAIDLPSGDPAADFPAYADACVQQLRNAGADNAAGDADIVVVAQSLGGFTAPVFAEGVAAERIVLVNAMIPLPHETPAHWFGTSGAGEARKAFAADEGRELGDDIDEMQEFFHDVPDDVVQEAVRQGGPDQSDAIMDCATPFDTWPTPVTVVTGRDDRMFPRDFQVRFARERLGVDAVVVPGGHLAALSQPAALADALL
ncbi:alpha/beta fold hydrolase [Gordonia sp. SID5947]|uniref:alpha/beta fold hydrolase n=1 Tax=Gordonia sp. SID5947 TaxID=2690315 RepID=UPI00136963DE|nr:alpha/beta fold hydrolase [Gordonia sp. SID5947]MYR04871.1 alpha/beta fold hydrolase [Gordonia sp. SID5947]